MATLIPVRFFKVLELPSVLIPNAFYIVVNSSDVLQNFVLTTSTGTPIVLNGGGGGGSVTWGSILGLLSNQSDLQGALNAKQSTNQKGQPNGYASLNASTEVPLTQIPNLESLYLVTANSGFTVFDYKSIPDAEDRILLEENPTGEKVFTRIADLPTGGGSSSWGGITGTLADQTDLQTALDAKQNLADKGAASGYAPLDSEGEVPLGNIPNLESLYLVTANSGFATFDYNSTPDGEDRILIEQNPTGEKQFTRIADLPSGGGSGDLLSTNNLSDLTNFATARTNLGLGNVDNTSDATKNSASATLTNKTISGSNNTLSNIAQSSVTNLTTDLAARVTLGTTQTITGLKTFSQPVTASQLRTINGDLLHVKGGDGSGAFQQGSVLVQGGTGTGASSNGGSVQLRPGAVTGGGVAGNVQFINAAGTAGVTWSLSALTALRVLTLPDSNGTVALDAQKQTNIQFKDEGSTLGTAGTVDEINFTGAGVVASRTGNEVTVNISGGGGGGEGGGDLLAANNLSDLANFATSRTNLGVAIGSDVQAWNAVLDAVVARLIPETNAFAIRDHLVGEIQFTLDNSHSDSESLYSAQSDVSNLQMRALGGNYPVSGDLVNGDCVVSGSSRLFLNGGSTVVLGTGSHEEGLRLTSPQLLIKTLNEQGSDGAVRMEFAGWDGGGYTQGLKIVSTDGAGNFPTHISLRNTAYSTNGGIATTNLPGLSFGSPSQSGATFTFGDQSVSSVRIQAGTGTDALHITATAPTISPAVLKLAASQTANAFEVQPNGSTTPLMSISAKGVLTLPQVDNADAPNSSIYHSNDSSGLVFKNPSGTVSDITQNTSTQTLTNKTLASPVVSGTISGTYTIGGTPTFPSSVTQNALAQTLTNKTLTSPTNVLEEITTTASSATPTPTGGSLRNLFTITALAANATFAAPSGTPANGNRLMIRVKDNGSARTLAWNAIYRALGVTLPTTTVAGKVLYIGAIYNSQDSRWDIVAVSQEA